MLNKLVNSMKILAGDKTKIKGLFKPKVEIKQVGIDIGSYAIKIVELFREKEKVKIKNLAYKKLEDASTRNSLIMALKECAAKAGILNRQVNIAVSGPSVIVRFVELPHMTAEELKNAVPFEAEKYIPFNIEEVILGHQVLVPRISNENKMLVLLVAAKKAFINSTINIASEAGLSIGIIDVASLAKVNAFSMSFGKKGEIAALVDVGAKSTDINILEDGILYFSRSIQLGGSDITKALSDAMSIDLKKAEEIKMNPNERDPEADEIIRNILQNIIDEVRLSFSYYENQSGKSVEKVFVTGGTSKIKEFKNLLQENIGIEISQWDPTAGVEIDAGVDTQLLASVKEQLGVAIGLALR